MQKGMELETHSEKIDVLGWLLTLHSVDLKEVQHLRHQG